MSKAAVICGEPRPEGRLKDSIIGCNLSCTRRRIPAFSSLHRGGGGVVRDGRDPGDAGVPGRGAGAQGVSGACR